LTKVNYQGLILLRLSDKNLQTINDEPGAGYGTQISYDGKTVMYNKLSFEENKRHNSLVAKNLSTGETKVLVNSTREPITGRFIQSSPAYVTGKKMVKASSKSTAPQYVVRIEDRKMVLYKNGTRKEILPNGSDASYLWPSISPDNQNIVYTVAGKGTFVCSIDGKNPVSLGKLNAPQWLGNKFIVGMNDIDNGEKLLSSTIKIVSIDGKTNQTIETPEGVNAMYPTASKDGSQIAFNTDKGEIYLVNVELK
jgi:Tol biopolymer transport system component